MIGEVGSLTDENYDDKKNGARACLVITTWP